MKPKDHNMDYEETKTEGKRSTQDKGKFNETER
jgi:hypothetical protein